MKIPKYAITILPTSISKKVVLTFAGILLLLSVNTNVSAQCLQGSFQPGRVFRTTGIPDLDARFNQEGTLIYSVFGVAPNMFIFDDRRSPNAYASRENTLQGYTGTVYFGLALLRTELWSLNKGGYAVAGIMAHEFAHILQFERDSELSGKARELHADFMAGYYLRKKSYIAPTNARAFAASLFEKGDYDFWSSAHHGTPQERVGAMVAGFQSGSLDLDSAYASGERLFSGTRGRTETRREAAVETSRDVSFTIQVAPLVPGKYATEITVHLDNNEVGQLSNTESPYKIDVENVRPGRHSYRISATIYGVNGYGRAMPVGELIGSGTIIVEEGNVYQVRADGNIVRLYKVR